MIRNIFVALFLLFGISTQSQPNELDSSKTFKSLTAKNYYLLHAINNNKEVRLVFQKDSVLNKISKKKSNVINISLENLDKDKLLENYFFTPDEISKVSSRLKEIYRHSEIVRKFVLDDIKPSGAYSLFHNKNGDELLSKAWELCAEGMNHVVNIYGKGIPPRYAKIDSLSYRVDSDYYKGALLMWSDSIHAKFKKSSIFYFEPLSFAVSLLYLNHRDESIRYEPLDELQNKMVLHNISSINFKKYDYSSILILGNGPENYMDKLSALGKLNIKLGAEKFLKGQAPIIIVSGGHAHPFRAEYCEAIEMKKELIKQYNILENQIVIEPYARHTTTNIRNAVRLMMDYNIPISKPSLVVTNQSHSDYTATPRFLKRCLDELGYVPAGIGKRLDKTTLEFFPNSQSSHKNPLDPLDP